MRPCDIGTEAAERYVAGSMAEPERTIFEDHFVGCEDCFHTVQALETARSVLAGGAFSQVDQKAGAALRGSGRGLPMQWMAAAAALIVVVGLSVMIRPGSNPEQVRPSVVAETPVAAPQGAPSMSPPAAALPAPSTPAPSVRPTPVGQDPARQDSAARLERWARVVPPQYVALTTRSGQDQDAGEISRRFEEAMAHYSAGRYREAASGLQALANQPPPAAHVDFFLGISELMADNVSRARASLQRSAESGVSPYADEAHFYLAKAALGAGDLTAAARELEIAVERDAGPEGDAAKLLAELRRVQRGVH